MSQAKITTNSVVGSNDDVPINTVVQFNNLNLGGELTYAWTLIDQPEGTADNLSSTVVQNPTLTPKKEGTYLVKLTVNQSLPDETSDIQLVAVRQLKTRQRIPAAGETTQDDGTKGWAAAMNRVLQGTDALLSDPGIIVGVAGQGGLTRGNVLRATGGAIIKSGLPGQETVPSFVLAPATSLGNVDELLVILEGGVDGNTSPANGALVQVRYIGRFSAAVLTSSVGATVYASDSSVLSTTPGTTRRQLGSVMASNGAGNCDVWFDGVGGYDITPISAPYVVFGNPGTLTNAVRVDGAGAAALTDTFLLIAKDTSTPALTLKAAGTGSNQPLQSWVNSANALIGIMDAAGLLQVASFFTPILAATTATIPTFAGDVTFNGNVTMNALSGVASAAALYALNDVVVDKSGGNVGALANCLRFGSTTAGEGISSKRSATGNQFGLDFWTASTRQMWIENNGTVHIPKMVAPTRTAPTSFSNSFTTGTTLTVAQRILPDGSRVVDGNVRAPVSTTTPLISLVATFPSPPASILQGYAVIGQVIYPASMDTSGDISINAAGNYPSNVQVYFCIQGSV